MYSELTEEQEEEAKEFFEVMSNCFQDPAECECDKISITSFSKKCEVMAPLAVECMAGNEDACEEMDQEDPMDLLPEHLQHVLEEVEMMYGEAHYDMYAPEECEGVSMEECMLIMFREHAPSECIAALDRGEIYFKSEHQAHRECERIMFDVHAPEECAGLSDPRECEKIMFERHAPKECIDAGLTGEFKADEVECKRMMEDIGFGGPNMGFGAHCRGIQNSEERLRCYDSAMDQDHSESYEERYAETKELERECAESCSEQGGAWDFSGGNCQCHFDDYDHYDEYYGDYGMYNPGGGPGEYYEHPEDYYQDYYGDYDNGYDGYYPGENEYYPENGYYNEGDYPYYEDDYYEDDYYEGEYSPEVEYPQEGEYYGEEYSPEYDDYYDEGYSGEDYEGDHDGGDYSEDYDGDYSGDSGGDYGGGDSSEGDYGGDSGGGDGGGEGGP